MDVFDHYERLARERLTPQKVPIERPFKAGHGRPDLDMLHNVVRAIDRDEDVLRIRNSVADYINKRPDEVPRD